MSNDLTTRQPMGLSEIESARAIQQVQAALTIAKKFPRNEREAIDRIMSACGRKALAESAIYSYSRGGTDINGPSIRLAETMAQNWGNLEFGIKELSQSNGISEVEAYCWDLETNTKQSKIFQVEHKRFTKKGTYKLEDPRDIYELIANNGARRLRACILGVIPGDIVESAVEQCEITLKATADTSPAGIKKIIDSVAKYEITKEMLEKKFARRIEAITPAQIIQLRKIILSIADGMSEVKDWFEIKLEIKDENVNNLNAQIKEKKSKTIAPEIVEIEVIPEQDFEIDPEIIAKADAMG